MMSASEEPIVIVGAGLAGYALARELRRRECSRSITIVTADSGRVYSKPTLSNALAQRRTAAALESASAAALAERLQLRVMTNTRATAIDRDARTLQTSGGPVRYSHLVLALGAQPIRTPLTGDAASQAMSVNDLDDYAAWRERLVAAGSDARVLVIGAGIAVNHMLATADPRIFALGDCAQVEGEVRPYVAPLLQAARALAATLSGVPTALQLDPAPVVVKTPSYPIVVLQPAVSGAAGRWDGERDASGVRLDWRDDDGVLRGFALGGDRCAQRPQLLAALGRPPVARAVAIA